ncbi:hypothetical protein [Streptomyces albipurpureus]|uniref:Uncharacterized protein n=1 Tax=Streptomyces albipurpureus TaxID=2897419 RepID=A0ABT0UIX3_9ACTN|nr:hypothetical protein [Streptomyces sp. CWNU-1]MCM2387383.1 hypothetical protein [Streptomyces sp. CWNU-1]
MQERCKQLGEGVGYALKMLGTLLQGDPLLGSPLGVPSLYIEQVDGGTLEGCPELGSE